MQIEKHWLSQQQMANACQITVSAFQKWQVEPVARVGRKTFYTVQDVLANRLEHHAKQLDQRPKQETPGAAEAAQREAKITLITAMAEGRELKNAQLREELAPTDLIFWVIERAGLGISRHLAGIPAAIKRKCPKLRPADIVTATREVERAQRIAARMPETVDEYTEAS